MAFSNDDRGSNSGPGGGNRQAPRRNEGRVPPHNLNAEESLLGALLLSRDVVGNVAELGLLVDHFYKPAHQHIYAAVRGLMTTGQPIDVVTVADELPSSVRRQPVLSGGFVCLYDPRRLPLKRLTHDVYFAQDHVVVSYNGDLRGIVEDALGKQRRVRCSVPSFANLGAIIEGSRLVATVPAMVARQIRALRPKLATKPLPFMLAGAQTELLWSAASDDDEPCRYVRTQILEIAKQAAK